MQDCHSYEFYCSHNSYWSFGHRTVQHRMRTNIEWTSEHRTRRICKCICSSFTTSLCKDFCRNGLSCRCSGGESSSAVKSTRLVNCFTSYISSLCMDVPMQFINAKFPHMANRSIKWLKYLQYDCGVSEQTISLPKWSSGFYAIIRGFHSFFAD